MKKQEDTLIAADGRKFKRVEYAFQGDYCGSTVERSNAEWLNLSKSEKNILWNWGISKRVDSWEALHLWGWDAHILAERRIIR